MGRDSEGKKHYNSLDREKEVIKDLDYGESGRAGYMSGKLEADEVLSYFIEGDKYFSVESRVNSILGEKDIAKRNEKIKKEVDRFFGKMVKKHPEIAVFFVEYVTANMNLEERRADATKEVVEEVQKLLKKEFGGMNPHKAEEQYMNAAGQYMKDNKLGEFEEPGFFKKMFHSETPEEESANKNKKNAAVLKYTSPEDVFMYLCDTSASGDLAHQKNKKLVVTGQQVSQAFKDVEALHGEALLLKNISYIMSQATKTQVNFDSKQKLYDFLQGNPNAKEQFLKFVHDRAYMKIDLNEFFIDPANALKRTMEIKQQINTDPLLKSTIDDIGRLISKKLDKEISAFEKRVAAATGPEKAMLQNTLNYIKNPATKKGILDEFKVRSGSAVFSRLKDYSGREIRQTDTVTSITEKEKGHSSMLAGVTIGNERINKYLQEYVKLFDDFSFDIGVGVIDGNPHIGIGPRLSGKREATENTKVKYSLGTYLLVPYGVLGGEYLANRPSLSNLKGLVGKELDLTSAHSFGGMINVSLMGGGAGVYWSREKLQGIDVKHQSVKKLLKIILTPQNLNKDPRTLYAELQKTDAGKHLKEDDLQSLIKIMGSAKEALSTFGDFNLLTPDQQASFLATNMVDAYSNRWRDRALVKAENDGWYIGGLFLGIQLWFNFFPSLAVIPDFKKVSVKFVEDPDSRATGLGKEATGAGVREIAATEQQMAVKLENLINHNSLGVKYKVNFDNGRFVIYTVKSGKSNVPSGFDPLSNLDIRFAPNVKNQIQYDGKKIVIGNISPIMPYTQDSINGRGVVLYLGGTSVKECTETLNLQNAQEMKTQLANNNPDAVQPVVSSAQAGAEGSQGYLEKNPHIDAEFNNYLDKNIDKFVGFQWVHVKDYPAFMHAYATGDYAKATDRLLSMISTDKSLRNDREIHQFSDKIRKLKSFAAGTPEHDMLEVLLSQFANVLMIDANTKDKIKSPDRIKATALHYVDDIFAKNPSMNPGKQQVTAAVQECLGNPAAFEKYRSMFSSLMGYQADQDILKNSGKKLYYLLRPIKDFKTERAHAFEQISSKEGLSSPSKNKYRDMLYDAGAEGGNNSWTTTRVDNVLGFYGSYKLNRQNTERIFSGFGYTPTGVTEIAVNQKTGKKLMVYVSESDVEIKSWVVNRLATLPSWENFKQSMFAIIGVKLNDADFKKLLIDGVINVAGQNINFDRKFCFYAYGHCLNEGLGMELGSVTTRGKSGQAVRTPLRFAANGMVVTNVAVGEEFSVRAGVVTSNPNETRKPRTTTIPNTPPTTDCNGYTNVDSDQSIGTGGDTPNY